MKLIKLTCPNCGGKLEMDTDDKKVYCPYCGQKLFVDYEHLDIEREKTKQEQENTKRVQIEVGYKSRRLLLVSILCGALLLIAISYVIFENSDRNLLNTQKLQNKTTEVVDVEGNESEKLENDGEITETAETTSELESSGDLETLKINKIIYSDNIINLTCKEIKNNSIVFEVSNKTDYDIEWLYLTISLDGTQLSLYSDDGSDKNISKREMRTVTFNGDIENVQHQRMSISGDIFIDGTSKGVIDVCDFELGGKENKISIQKNRKIYDDEILTVYYNKINLDSVQFVVDNKRHNAITVGFWNKVTINGVEYNASVVGINALSSGKYSAGLTSLDGSSVQITEFKKFEGIMTVLDAHNGKLEDVKLDFSES